MKSLQPYLDLLDQAKEDVKLNAKTIQEASMEHASLYLFYADKLCELKIIAEKVKLEIDIARSKCTIRLNENHSISLNSTLITKYLDSEPDIIKAIQLYLEVEEVRLKFGEVVEAFKTRGYQLNNITKQRVTQIEDSLL